MKLKSVLLLAVAMSCGLVAMLGVQQILKGDKNGDSDKDVAKVLIVTTEIDPGTPLNDNNVTFREWPKDTIPEGAVTTEEEYTERALRVRGVTGEIVMKAKLGDKGVFGASNDIPDGMRVMTIAVDLTMSSSGLIWPGDRVDVLVTYSERDPRLGSIKRVKTALEHVKVFATDNVRDVSEMSDTNQNKTKNMSLLVTPEEMEILKLAEDMGELHLALRGPSDDSRSDKSMLFDPLAARVERDTESSEEATEKADDVNQFLDRELSDGGNTESAPAPTMWAIEIFAGGERRVEEVELPEEPVAEPTELAVHGVSVSAGATATGKPWLDHLKKFFDKAQP